MNVNIEYLLRRYWSRYCKVLLWITMDAMDTIQNNSLTYPLGICFVLMHFGHICIQRSYRCNCICHLPNMKTHWIQETCSYMHHMKDNCKIHPSMYHKVAHEIQACRNIVHWWHRKWFLSDRNYKVCRNWCHSNHNNQCHPPQIGPKNLNLVFSFFPTWMRNPYVHLRHRFQYWLLWLFVFSGGSIYVGRLCFESLSLIFQSQFYTNSWMGEQIKRLAHTLAIVWIISVKNARTWHSAWVSMVSYLKN